MTIKFEYEDGELSILDKNLPDDDNEILNYVETLGGHTLMIDKRFELVKVEGVNNLYSIKQRVSNSEKK